MFVTSKAVEGIIQRKTGLSMDDILSLSPEDEEQLVFSLKKGIVSFPYKRNSRKIGRGNPLLARHRIRTIGYVNDRISKICNL